jgi:hypothetical protein
MKKPYTEIKLYESKDIPDEIFSYLSEIFIDSPWVVQPPDYGYFNVARKTKDKYNVAVSSWFIRNGAKYGETVLIHFT